VCCFRPVSSTGTRATICAPVCGALDAFPFSGAGGEQELIVVDNASGDGSADMVRREFPQVRLFANACNENYARGTNQALQAARGDLLLLLNPDAQVTPGALDTLADFCCPTRRRRRRPEVGSSGRDARSARSGAFPNPARSFGTCLVYRGFSPAAAGSARTAKRFLTMTGPARRRSRWPRAC
jgi:glycosyltransferase involved in cell wall biosynthesis